LLKDRHELVLETNERLLEIYDSFSKDKRKELEDEANRVFEKFADESTKKDITNLTIDDQYELGTANWAGKNFLGELSAGQRQLVSLCFITALIRIAGNIEVPLFMDTPFGRLGGSPREKLLKSVPGLISQWILLATDTEFTSIEADILKNTGHWGKVYVLEKLDAGITKIVNNNVDGFVPKREYSN
jgi:DNA sulfur modification protein DndD